MGQILCARNSGAIVGDEEAERGSTHPHSMVDWLQSQRHYIMSLWLQLKGVDGGPGYSCGILAPAPLHEILIKSLLFRKVDHSFVR